MTWQLGAFSILALALAGGFAWYERSRPDARIVALVGTLAAFAALGRIAFAALPNVKPTSDIVLISGYALGGGPGFAVGAIAGLTSNFFFGQGPWTPWQMAAWGVTGLIGAGLAVVTRGHIKRWPLALVCMVAGFAFALVQDVGDWVTYSDHSPGQLGVYVGKGIGFDFIHAAGCLVFALAFGPALLRSVARFSRRLNVTWRPLDAAAGPVIAVCLACGVAGLAAGSARAASSPAGYLLAAQHSDGGFGSSPGAPSSTLYAGWAALGLASAGHNPLDVSHGGRSVLAYVRAGGYSDTGSLERTILVVRAAGTSARNFGGHDLIGALERRIRGDGSLSDQVNWTAFAVMALRSDGISPPSRMLGWLARQQNGDGGFSFASGGGASDIDDTGAALEALGRGGSASARAVRYLRHNQNADGGFPSEPGGDSNAQSTAWAIQGLLAAGANPSSLHRGGAMSPTAYLRSLIVGDGHVRYSRTSDQTPVWVTAEALMAIERKPLPLAPVGRRGGGGGAGGGGGGGGTRIYGVRAALASRTGNRQIAARARAHRARGAASASGEGASAASLLKYAGDAALLTALVLAPVGEI
jgi:energy-coupling factor transport system substrate-specific component